MCSLKPAIDGLDFSWFSWDQPRFDPCLGRLVIHWSTSVQTCWIFGMWILLAAIAYMKLHICIPVFVLEACRTACFQHRDWALMVPGPLIGYHSDQPLCSPPCVCFLFWMARKTHWGWFTKGKESMHCSRTKGNMQGK